MGSVYLQPGEYAAFGVPKATADKVASASLYIDGYLRRPEGLIWSPDCNGDPCFMAALSPSNTLTLPNDISPGSNVVVNVTGAVGAVQPGDVLIADRATTNLAEALLVVAKNGRALTFASVQNAHASGAKLDAGLDISEQRNLPKSRPLMNVTKTPVQRILSGIGRYGYTRRGDTASGSTDDFNLLAVYNQFGGPPAWEIFNATSCDFDARTGQVWIPAGIMLAYYTEVRLRYIAGFSQANLPDAVKLACAKLILALGNDPDLGPAKSYKAGDTAITKFSDTIISGDIGNMLSQYRARVMA